jgi:hypothetical protein
MFEALRDNWLRIAAVVVVCIGGWNWWSTRPVLPPPGIGVHASPVQNALSTPRRFEHEGHQVEAVASFDVTARVLGVARYSFDRAAAVSPLDLALGWGRMSDSAVLDRIEISQSGRFYYWRTRDFPIPRREIEASSANMHMIPASAPVRSQLNGVRVGQIVRLQGYLVRVQGRDGWRWASSLSREDTGNGACEVIWVESVEIRG